MEQNNRLFLDLCERGAQAADRQRVLRASMELTPHGTCSNAYEHGEDCFAMYQDMFGHLGGYSALPHT